jgi:hypothetical protein
MTKPTITGTTVTSILQTTATGGGNVTGAGGGTISARGVAWGASANPTITGSTHTTLSGNTLGAFTTPMTGLTQNTLYHVRAYATNSTGTTYATGDVTFTTLATAPAVITTVISSIAQTTATGGGNVTGDLITARGICWGTSSTPTTGNSKTVVTGTTGTFVSSLTGLLSGTTYYVRAYALNNGGITYGNQVSFTTLTIPTVTTTTISAIGQTTATGGGNVTTSGGTTITARGVCWSTGATPTTGNNKTIQAGAVGSFVSSLTGLTLNTLYYVRAYATNSVGTTYGTAVSFTTLPLLGTIITTPITMITEKNANGGGNVTAGTSIVHRGVVWGTSSNPVITGNTKTIQTGTTGIFISTLTGLTKNTTYYARAYVTNTDGTSYGVQIKFVATTTEISTVGYDLYLKTGIGDKSIFDAEFAAVARTIYVDVTYTPEEIVLGNIK